MDKNRQFLIGLLARQRIVAGIIVSCFYFYNYIKSVFLPAMQTDTLSKMSLDIL